MNSTQEKITKAISEIISKVEDKELIGQLSNLNNDIKELGEVSEKKDKEYKELLDDYKELVLHTSFVPNKSEEAGRGSPKPVSLEEAFETWKSNQKK